jgi:hypothetical protein
MDMFEVYILESYWVHLQNWVIHQYLSGTRIQSSMFFYELLILGVGFENIGLLLTLFCTKLAAV